jgi:hypothetical protein
LPIGYALRIHEYAIKFDKSDVYVLRESPHDIDKRAADRGMFMISAPRSTARALYGKGYAKQVQEELEKMR